VSFCYMSVTLLLLLVAIVSTDDSTHLYPFTLINTDLVCETIADCYAYHNNSWCATGFLCLRRQCKVIPEFPCRATQVCKEESQLCIDTPCTDDSECDNQVFCDGVEVCRNNICIMDPQQPSCLFLGGVCDEMARDCQLPRAHQLWQKEHSLINVVKKKAGDMEGNNSTETTTTVNLTSLIIVGSVMGVIFIGTLIVLLTRATQGAMKPNKY
jgi:hypothetical protein